MGYKVLGYVVWQGTKLYLNRKTPNSMTGRRVGIAGVVALGIVGVLIAQRSSDS